MGFFVSRILRVLRFNAFIIRRLPEGRNQPHKTLMLAAATAARGLSHAAVSGLGAVLHQVLIIMKLYKDNQRLAIYATTLLGILLLSGFIIICVKEPSAAADVLKAAALTPRWGHGHASTIPPKNEPR